MYRNMLYASCAFVLLLYVLNQAALNNDLFWKIWWYDIPMHFLGGLVLGCGFVWFFGSLQERMSPFSDFTVVLSVLGAVFIGGVVWELYEYWFNLAGNPFFSYAVDTGKDIIMDMLGAIAAIWFYKRKRVSITKIT